MTDDENYKNLFYEYFYFTCIVFSKVLFEFEDKKYYDKIFINQYIFSILFFFQAKMEVEDLFTDLADGIKLLKLLEIISGEKLGKPNSGKMRVHKIENVNKSLAFLHTKVSETLYNFS